MWVSKIVYEYNWNMYENNLKRYNLTFDWTQTQLKV